MAQPLRTCDFDYRGAAVEYYWYWRNFGFNMQYPYKKVAGLTKRGLPDYEYTVNWLAHNERVLNLFGYEGESTMEMTEKNRPVPAQELSEATKVNLAPGNGGQDGTGQESQGGAGTEQATRVSGGERNDNERDEVSATSMTVGNLIDKLCMFDRDLGVRITDDEDNVFDVKAVIAGDSLHVEITI